MSEGSRLLTGGSHQGRTTSRSVRDLMVFLEGPPEYYPALDSRPANRRTLAVDRDAAFQALRLPEHKPWMTGTRVYSETFWRYDAVGLRDTSL